MKVTLDINDALLRRAKRLSQRTRRPLRMLVEEGLRHVLSQGSAEPRSYALPDCSVGDAAALDPQKRWSWPQRRDEIYGEPSPR